MMTSRCGGGPCAGIAPILGRVPRRFQTAPGHESGSGGEETMSEGKRTLKQRAFHGLREYLVISFYLFVVFSLFAIYKSVILAEHHIDFAPHGLALINALALAKVMLVAQELHLADQFRDAPLIYPTLLKSFAFTIVLACFKIAEEAAVGMFHRKSVHESIAVFAGGSWKGVLSLTVLLFVVLVPFFGFTELRRVFGEDRLVGAFFRPRHLLNPPPTGL
ncbi:MAG TPA: hypothetical protein VG759_00265 [Candidatus Angelobacter sp.]|nr:hypothetical protein [Candidatus Angelobacter sp.]